ncbi:Histidine kinase [Pseudomonas sp. 8Z]|uniref:sensor histidine kinase n=1 Tax=Pseudomonas sp. 8Z TaxID=2653166 RepID=UPI0012F22415|nr:ATP-binding protein [Pseudomonas sp. 8Z]VXD05262.1 Histidine kinase [Pseudomonas sp. 8Z]
MFQALLRSLLPVRSVAATMPAYRQALLELPLRALQQGCIEAPLRALLPLLADALQAQQVSLLLPQAGAPGWRLLGASLACVDGSHDQGGVLPGSLQLCERCLAQGRFLALCGLHSEQERVASMQVAFAQRPDARQRECLREIARQLAEVLLAFAAARRLKRSELSAEHGVLARELHDSVAQQLGYLQIRSHRLQQLLADPQQGEQAQVMLEELRDTLRTLQRQVRELISSARLTMDGRTLRQALEASVAEFARCSSCVFSLDNRLPGHCLPTESELQVLQIVREALANVVRHSHARQVWIRLWPSADGGAVEVCDDGVGLPQHLPPTGHFGLHIMRERAAAIGAELRIEPSATGGTRVLLRWGAA